MILLPLLLVVTYSAAESIGEQQRRQILGIASAAAPEIHAAALLRFVEAGVPAKARAEYLEQAFVLASQAVEAYPRLRAYGAPPDTSDSYRAAASSLGLDRLTLQTRAARLNPELYARIEPPQVGKVGCESGTVPDLGGYYATADALHAASGHLELAAVAKHIQTPELAESFAARLASAPADSRAFAASWQTMRAELTRMISQFPSPSLAEATRKYIVNAFTTPRCADGGHVYQSAREVMEWFNGIRLSAPALDDAAFAAPKLEGRAKVEDYWQEGANQALMQGLRDLRFHAEGGIPFSEAERRGSEWKQSLEQYLSRLDAARPGFHQTAALLQALIEFTPRGPERDRLLARFLDTLRVSNLQQKAPAEWLWRADSLFQMLRQSSDPDAEKLLAGFRNGGVPALVLYAWFHQNMGVEGMF